MSELKRVLSQHHAQEMRGKLGGSAMCICGQGCGSTEACGEYAILLRDLTTATAKIEALEAKLAAAERLFVALKESKTAILSLPPDSLGWGEAVDDNHELYRYPLQHELLDSINSALEAFEALQKENTDA